MTEITDPKAPSTPSKSSDPKTAPTPPEPSDPKTAPTPPEPSDPKTAPTPPEPSAKKGWKVISPVSHDGISYAPDEILPADAITDVQAAALMERGVIGPN